MPRENDHRGEFSLEVSRENERDEGDFRYDIIYWSHALLGVSNMRRNIPMGET